jgi:hypothetical protein
MPRAIVRPETLTAWSGASLLIVTTDGQCREQEPLTGYYFREARFLRVLRLAIDGEPPWPCEASSLSPTTLSFAYVYPEIAEFGGGGSDSSGDDKPVNARGIPQRALAIDVTYTVVPHGLIIDVRIGNHPGVAVECGLAFDVDADFADIQEALGGRREQEAPVRRDRNDRSLVFRYDHDRLRYQSTVHAMVDRGWRISKSRIETSISLQPQETIVLRLDVEPSDSGGEPLHFETDARGRALSRVDRALRIRFRASQSRGRRDRRRQHSGLRIVSAARGRARRVARSPGGNSAVSRAVRPGHAHSGMAGRMGRPGRIARRQPDPVVAPAECKDERLAR